MLTNKMADDVIATALAELAADNKRPAQTRRGEPLGDYVIMVFEAVTGGEHTLPVGDAYRELRACNTKARCREILLSDCDA